MAGQEYSSLRDAIADSENKIMGLSVSRIEVEKWTEDDVANVIIKHIGGNISQYGTNVRENCLNGITLIHIGEKQLRNSNDINDIDNTNIMQKSLLDLNITNLIHQSRLIMEWKSIMKQICNNNNDDDNNNNIISQDDNNNDKNNNNNNKKKQQQDGDITTTTNDNKNDNIESIFDTTTGKNNQKEDASTTTTTTAVTSFIRPYSWNPNDNNNNIKLPPCVRFNDKTLKSYGRLYKQRLRIDIPHRPISLGNKPEAKCQLHRWSSGLELRAAIVRCRECNVHLCITCFQIYHETDDLLAIKNDLSIRFHQEKLDKIESSNNNKKQKTEESYY